MPDFLMGHFPMQSAPEAMGKGIHLKSLIAAAGKFLKASPSWQEGLSSFQTAGSPPIP
jgi:hypothetical protein